MSIKQVSRVMGFIWIITSLLWAVLGAAGLLYGLNWLDNLEVGLDDNLYSIIDSLESVHGIVVESTDVVSATQASLATVQLSVHDTGIALADARPLLWTTTKVVTGDVPDALDGVHEAMPSLIETAKSVDETLSWLSGIGFTVPNPLGPDWSFDLGVDYQPEVPLDQALENMSGNLESVPDDLRDMKESLNDADANLVIVSDDLALLAGDLEIMNEQMSDINPRLDALAGNIEDIQVSFEEMQGEFPKSFRIVRNLIVVILILLIFTQIPSIYMGWVLASGHLLWADKTDKA